MGKRAEIALCCQLHPTALNLILAWHFHVVLNNLRMRIQIDIHWSMSIRKRVADPSGEVAGIDLVATVNRVRQNNSAINVALFSPH